MENKVILSTLNHTWLLDLDGTILKHNGYKIDGYDTFLPGAKEFLISIPQSDTIIFLTSREYKYKKMTESFLKKENIRYNLIIYALPYGERILINDKKESGLDMAYGVNTKRDEWCNIKLILDAHI